MKVGTIIFVLFPLVGGVAAANISDHALQHDPFSKSKLEKLQKIGGSKQQERNQVTRWRPKLLATIVDGENSLANVDGKIVRLGGLVNKFRLIKVNRYSVTFQHNDRKLNIKLYNKAAKQ